MNKRQKKKLFKKVAKLDYTLTWRQKLFVGSDLSESIVSEIRKEIDKEILSQIIELAEKNRRF